MFDFCVYVCCLIVNYVTGKERMELLDGEIAQMIKDAQEIVKKKHEYIVHNGKIGYIDNDNICTNIFDRYRTMFAYYKEHKRGNISNAMLNSVKKLNICCGHFSYCEIPSQFDNIIGVTATLKTLSKKQTNIMQNKYNIKYHTYMPSIFKQNDFIFDKKNDIKICKTNDSFKKDLTFEILKRRQQVHNNSHNNNEYRPILVFFETWDLLKEYYKSDECINHIKNELGTQCLLLTQELSQGEKEQAISDACRLNTITLATRIFGRGTDFKIKDDNVTEIGGAHVIQTFYSIEESEERQIKGRTARYGGNGSYSMVLKQDELIRFNYKDIDRAISSNSIYNTLKRQRDSQSENKYAKIMHKVDVAKPVHDKTQELVSQLSKGNDKQIINILVEFNKARSNS